MCSFSANAMASWIALSRAAGTATGTFTFEHRQHRLKLQIALEPRHVRPALLLILPSLFKEFRHLGDLRFVIALGFRIRARGTPAAKQQCDFIGEIDVRQPSASSARRDAREQQVHRGRPVDLHVFPRPAVHVDQSGLPGNELRPAASATTAAAGGRKGHHAGDSVGANHRKMRALRIHRAQRLQLRHEFAQFAGIHRHALGPDFRKAEFRIRIDHSGIEAQAFALDDLHAFWRDEFGPDIGDFSVLDQYGNALHLGTRDRINVHAANQERIVRRRACGH